MLFEKLYILESSIKKNKYPTLSSTLRKLNHYDPKDATTKFSQVEQRRQVSRELGALQPVPQIIGGPPHRQQGPGAQAQPHPGEVYLQGSCL